MASNWLLGVAFCWLQEFHEFPRARTSKRWGHWTTDIGMGQHHQLVMVVFFFLIMNAYECFTHMTSICLWLLCAWFACIRCYFLLVMSPCRMVKRAHVNSYQPANPLVKPAKRASAFVFCTVSKHSTRGEECQTPQQVDDFMRFLPGYAGDHHRHHHYRVELSSHYHALSLLLWNCF